MNKVSDVILTLQKLTNIWVFHATEEVRQEDVATVLPREKGMSEDKTSVTTPGEEQAVKQVTVTKALVSARVTLAS